MFTLCSTDDCISSSVSGSSGSPNSASSNESPKHEGFLKSAWHRLMNHQSGNQPSESASNANSDNSSEKETKAPKKNDVDQENGSKKASGSS